MKKIIIYSFVVLFLACAGKQELSPSETSKIVVESFYTKDNGTIKKYTTPEGYNGMIAIQNFVGEGNTTDSNFKVLNETTEGDTTWIKFTTSYDAKPETFKLVKENGQWKVTQQGVREKSPF